MFVYIAFISFFSQFFVVVMNFCHFYKKNNNNFALFFIFTFN